MICLVTFLLQKCFEMVFVKFRRFSAAGRVVDVKIAIFELCKPFSCHRFAYDTFPYTMQMSGLLQQLFGLDEKQRIASVENVAFYPLDIPYVSLTNNKISKYSKRQSAQFFTVERALSNEYAMNILLNPIKGNMQSFFDFSYNRVLFFKIWLIKIKYLYKFLGSIFLKLA